MYKCHVLFLNNCMYYCIYLIYLSMWITITIVITSNNRAVESLLSNYMSFSNENCFLIIHIRRNFILKSDIYLMLIKCYDLFGNENMASQYYTISMIFVTHLELGIMDFLKTMRQICQHCKPDNIFDFSNQTLRYCGVVHCTQLKLLTPWCW